MGSLAFCLFQSISGVDRRRNIIFSSEVISSSFSILVYHISVIFIFRKTGVINFTFSYIYLKLTTPTPPPPLHISWFLIVTVLGFCWTRNYQSDNYYYIRNPSLKSCQNSAQHCMYTLYGISSKTKTTSLSAQNR